MFLELQHIAREYDGQRVLKDISFSMTENQTMSILGKSGCGKSTLLKIVAGLETSDSGTVRLKGKDISKLKPETRNIVYLFQEALLFPNLNVRENIGFGLRIRHVNGSELQAKVAEMIENLQLSGHEKKMPHQLSGGQKQRVAFGRALIIQPPLILLDEPFSSLDAETRASMQELYKRVAAYYSLTALFVTHDIKEALIMGEVMSYMQDGHLQVYASREAFIADTKTGVQQELAFWGKIS